jgi:hypothetical protein
MAENQSIQQDLDNDPFLATLQDKLLKQSDIISSSNTGIEDAISKSIASIQKGQKASVASIESAFDREKLGVAESGEIAKTAFAESRSGFATQTAVLRQILDSTDKNLKDLEQRKQELILQGEAEAASQIAGLQLKELEFKQKSQQDVFNNLLGLSNLGISISAERRAQSAEQRANEQFNFQKEQAVANIALEFGLETEPGESLSDIINRAQPLASQKARLELTKAQKEIDLINTQIAKAQKDAQSFSASDIENLAKGALLNPALLSTIDDPDTLGSVINRMADLEGDLVVKPIVNAAIDNNDSLDEILKDIGKSPNITDKLTAQKIATEVFKSRQVTKDKKKLGHRTGSPLFDIFYGAGAFLGLGAQKGVEIVIGENKFSDIELF